MLPAPEGGGWCTQFCLPCSHPAEAPQLAVCVVIYARFDFFLKNETEDRKIQVYVEECLVGLVKMMLHY